MRHSFHPFVRKLTLHCAAASTTAAVILNAGCTPNGEEDLQRFLKSLWSGILGEGNIADFSRAGAQLMGATYSGTTVTIQNFSGSFGQRDPSVIEIGFPVTGVRVVDFNNDRLPDVLVTTQRYIYVIEQLNTAYFDTPVLIDDAGTNGYVSAAVNAVDLNGDGLPDLVFASKGADTGVYVRLNTTAPGQRVSFASRSGTPVPFQISAEVVSTFLSPPPSPSVRNGLVVARGPDLFAMRFDGVDRMVFINATTGAATSNTAEAAVRDIDITCNITRINAGPGLGSVYFPAPQGCASCAAYQYSVGSDGRLPYDRCVPSTPADENDAVAPTDILLVDLTNDGIPDLVLARPDRNEVGVRIGLATGEFGPERAFPVPGIDSLRSKLIDDDDYPDILAGSTANNSTTLLFNDRNGGVYTRSNRPGRTTPNSLVVADFDGDGYADALTRGPNLANAWSLYRGGPNTPGDFSQTPINLPNTGAFFPALDTPVVAYKPPASVSAAKRIAYVDSAFPRYINVASISVTNGVGTLTPLPRIDLGFSFPARDLVAADLDGDGDDDLIVPFNGSSFTDPKAVVIYQNANGSFGSPTPLRLDAFGATYWARVGKFTPGAGRDIVTQRGVLRNDGGGVFTAIPNSYGPLAPLFAPIAIGDIDGDGTDDVIGGYQTRTVPTPEFTTFVCLNNGDGTFLPAQALLTTNTLPEQISLDSGPSTTDGPGPKILTLTIRATNAISARRLLKQFILRPGFTARANSSTYLDLGTGQVNFFLPPQGVTANDGAPAPRPALVVASAENGPYGGLSVYPSIGDKILPCIGDANRDRRIDFLDLNTVLAFYGTSQPIGKNGDVSYDGVVNFNDLNLVLSRYGSACSP